MNALPRNLVPSRKQATHKLSGTKGGLRGPKRVPRPLFEQHSSGCHRQHYSGCLYKQRRGDEVGPSVYPFVETCARRQVTLKAQHIPGRLNVIDKLQNGPEWSLLLEVFQAICNQCHQVQQPTATVCVTGSRPPDLGSGCAQSVLGRSGPICLPTSSHLGQSGGEVAGLPM